MGELQELQAFGEASDEISTDGALRDDAKRDASLSPGAIEELAQRVLKLEILVWADGCSDSRVVATDIECLEQRIARVEAILWGDGDGSRSEMPRCLQERVRNIETLLL